MRTPAQRGRYGQWLVAAREKRGFSTAAKALAALTAAGIHIGRSAYAEYESGTKTPSRNHLPLLEEFWGPVGEPVEDQPDLAGALSELAEELGAVRREREAWERGVLAVLRSYRDGQVPAELLDALAPQPREDARR
jgi:transcriptional regulator with XRE-family HTH domain